MIVYHAPAANTDGDSLVFFRRSEVITAGNIFSTVSYPVIDVEKGGTIQGVIDGLNQILDLAVAEYRAQGGTWVIPGRGRLSDTADVASYRNMVTMIRDRIQDLKSKGMTLAAGEGGPADAGLRRPLWRDHRCRGQRTCSSRLSIGLSRRRSNAQSGLPRRSAQRCCRHGQRTPTIPTPRPTTSANEVKLEGKLVQFVYRNPHSFVHIQAPDQTGAPAAVGGRVGRHRPAGRAGVQHDTLKVGDRSSSSAVRRACPASTGR